MRRIFLLAAVLLLCISIEAQHILVKDGSSKTEILFAVDADSLSKKAASELQSYIQLISQADISIMEKRGRAYPIFIGQSFLEPEDRRLLLAEASSDAFLIRASHKGLYLAGKESLGDLYAVYALLEDYLGCIRFSVDETFIPQNSILELPDIFKIYRPDFPFRVPHFIGRWDNGFSQWHRISNFDQWGMFVHTFERLVPADTYYKDQPEYFALVDGRRLKDGQLCLSNPSLMKLLTRNLAKEIEKHPEKTYWSVSQNDCYNYCECEACQELYDKYGSISGAYVDMSNQLATTFPDKQISTLAYQFTRAAPQNIKPLDNVNIMFCSIECNRSMPLEDDPRSAGFVKDMKDWNQLTDNIFAWDYVVQFKNYLCPFPNFHVLQPNIKFFYENGVNMMFQQGSGHSWSDLADMKQYLIAKLLWDRDLDADSVVNHFIDAYYGDAAPYIKKYFELSHASLIAKQQTQNLDIYGFPVFYYEAHLTAELLLQYEEFMDAAEKAVETDSVFLKRVLRSRIPADFALLDVALNRNSDLIEWVVTDDEGNLQINERLLAKLNRFVDLCQVCGVNTINERSFRPADYRDFTMRKLQWQIKSNLLSDAQIALSNPPSPKYPVGGTQALTDALLGGLDYRFNWMGFEGQHMELEADFGALIDISKVQMNFLKAVNSWIFLPEEVKVEFSVDGLHYTEVASLKGDNTDRSYLVKSIPFVMEIPEQKVRYLRITATSILTNPEWHRGFGRPSWIFVDEIIVE